MPLEGLPADVAREGGLSGVDADVLPQLVGRVEALLAVAALERANLEVALPVVPKQARLKNIIINYMK